MVLQALGHVFGQVSRVVVELVLEPVDAVQLEENARFGLVVPVAGVGAGAQVGGDVKVAGGLGVRRVGSGAGLAGGHVVLVLFQKRGRPLGPPAPAGHFALVALLILVEHDHGGIDQFLGLERPESQPGRDADDPVVALPFGTVFVQGLEEDDEHHRPEGGQAAVVDDVEDEDEQPRLGGPRQDLAGLLVVQQILYFLQSMALHGFDGGAT